MDKNTYNKYEKQYNAYMDVLDIPTVYSSFEQDDLHAVEYCSEVDFITLIVPFGKNSSGNKYETVYLKNDLVTYSRMYSELQGGSVSDEKDKKNFLDSAISLSKKNLSKKNLTFEEVYPIAFAENVFNYNDKQLKHRGVVFVGRLKDNQAFNDNQLSIRNINDGFLFSNPHNDVIFSIVKSHVQSFRIDENLTSERKIANKLIKINVAEKKKLFLNNNDINKPKVNPLKKRIISDIKMKEHKKVIDIACGNDDIIYDLLDITNIQVFANDIALPYILKYHSKQNRYHDIIFTNLNAIDAKFKKDAFDVLLCKNLLHHVQPNLRIRLLTHLLDISKQVLIVEILHFDEQNENGKKIHEEFYNNELNEVKGKLYLHYQDILNLCNQAQAQIELDEKEETYNGIYAYIWVTKKSRCL